MITGRLVLALAVLVAATAPAHAEKKVAKEKPLINQAADLVLASVKAKIAELEKSAQQIVARAKVNAQSDDFKTAVAFTHFASALEEFGKTRSPELAALAAKEGIDLNFLYKVRVNQDSPPATVQVLTGNPKKCVANAVGFNLKNYKIVPKPGVSAKYKPVDVYAMVMFDYHANKFLSLASRKMLGEEAYNAFGNYRVNGANGLLFYPLSYGYDVQPVGRVIDPAEFFNPDSKRNTDTVKYLKKFRAENMKPGWENKFIVTMPRETARVRIKGQECDGQRKIVDFKRYPVDDPDKDRAGMPVVLLLDRNQAESTENSQMLQCYYISGEYWDDIIPDYIVAEIGMEIAVGDGDATGGKVEVVATGYLVRPQLFNTSNPDNGWYLVFGGGMKAVVGGVGMSPSETPFLFQDVVVIGPKGAAVQPNISPGEGRQYNVTFATADAFEQGPFLKKLLATLVEKLKGDGKLVDKLKALKPADLRKAIKFSVGPKASARVGFIYGIGKNPLARIEYATSQKAALSLEHSFGDEKLTYGKLNGQDCWGAELGFRMPSKGERASGMPSNIEGSLSALFGLVAPKELGAVAGKAKNSPLKGTGTVQDL